MTRRALKVRAACFLIIQAFAAFAAADYVVLHSVPYAPLGQLSTWQSIARWPWMAIYRWNPNLTFMQMMAVLCALYSVAFFVLIRYAIVRAIKSQLGN
jgi:hypothetical protein